MAIVTCSSCGTRNRVVASKSEAMQPRCGKCGQPLKVASASAEPLVVTDESFQRDVLGAPGLVLLDCWAPWCGPCRMVGPIMDQLARESDGRYRIAKLNVDENPRTASQFQIQSIPTMLLFKDGKLIDRLIGAQPKQAIADKLAKAA
ncbi:MAG TPA: thioredoxin [Pyrinomonadaceae bacterium]|nr:thioredoxin [Pyrinomonadaceae bacterium]